MNSHYPTVQLRRSLGWCAVFALAIGAGCASHPRHQPAGAKVVFENEKVRVINYHTGSEKNVCGFGMHTHPPHVYVMLTDAKLRIVTPDGKEIFEDSKAGDTGWADAEQHIVENLSGRNAACSIIEIKDKDWKPSTGLAR